MFTDEDFEDVLTALSGWFQWQRVGLQNRLSPRLVRGTRLAWNVGDFGGLAGAARRARAEKICAVRPPVAGSRQLWVMTAWIRASLILLVLAVAAPVLAHPGHDDAAQGDAGPGDEPASHVKIDVWDGFRYITANGLPDHETGKFPGPGNPNTMSAQTYAFRVPVKPVAAEKPVSVAPSRGKPPMLVGVALNGVVFDPGTAEFWNDDRSSGWNYEALSGKINLGLDSSNAHVQPNGAYHYHGLPGALIDKLAGASKGTKMVQVGWAADGYPIYASWGPDKAADGAGAVRELKASYRIKAGDRPKGESSPGGKYDGTFVQDYEYVAGSGDLDECNGRAGVTPEFPAGTYYYVLTREYPFVPRLLHGTPDESFRKRPPQGGPGGGPRGGGPGGRRNDPPPARDGNDQPAPPQQ